MSFVFFLLILLKSKIKPHKSTNAIILVDTILDTNVMSLDEQCGSFLHLTEPCILLLGFRKKHFIHFHLKAAKSIYSNPRYCFIYR